MSLTQIRTESLAAEVTSAIVQAASLPPKITSINYPGDDTAADPAGNQVVYITGNNFSASSTVYINGTQAGVVSYINSTSISFITPAVAAGVASLYVVNPDGGTAIAVPGLVYSSIPVWSTSSGSVGSPYETASFSVNLSATGDGSVTYAMSSGNSLPSGLTLAANGLLSGTIPTTDPTTTYTFYVDAIDSQNQETSRSFSVTYTKDEVTWSSPANGAAYSLTSGVANTTALSANSAAGKTITYSVQSGSLPSGLTISGANVTGTPNATQSNTSVVIRATAADTSRYADRTFYYLVQSEPDQYFANVTLLIRGNGSNGSTTFTDESTLNNTVTTYTAGIGQVYVTTDSPKYGTGSIRFSGNNTTENRAGLEIPYNTSYNFRSDATLEFHVRVREYVLNPSVGGSVHIIASLQGGGITAWFLSIFTEYMRMDLQSNELPPGYGGTYSESFQEGTPIPLNTWIHYAIVRSGNTFTMYRNGTSVASKTIAGEGLTIMNVYNAPGIPLRIGMFSGWPFVGSNIDLDDVRFTNFARYTSNFTAPTRELPAN